MNRRKSRSTRERARIFALHKGECHLCGGKIQVGQAYDLDHVLPLALGGSEDDTNVKPAHVKCHRGTESKTSSDKTMIAKADRIKAKHNGTWRKSKWSFGR